MKKKNQTFSKVSCLHPLWTHGNLSQTPMVKNIDKVTWEAKEVFQSMAFVYLSHKKNLKMEKSCKIWVWQVLSFLMVLHLIIIIKFIYAEIIHVCIDIVIIIVKKPRFNQNMANKNHTQILQLFSIYRFFLWLK